MTRAATAFPSPRVVARLFAFGVIALGAAVLTGWHWNVAALTGGMGNLAAMKPNTAAGLLLCGAALALLCTEGPGAWRCRAIAALLSVCLLALVGMTLSQDMLGVDLGIDAWLLGENAGAAPEHLFRMSPATALCFAFAGLALLIDCAPRPGRVQASTLVSLGLSVLVIGAMGFAGHTAAFLLNQPWWNYSGMPAPTTVGFLLVGAALLARGHARSAPPWSLDRVVSSGFALGLLSMVAAATLSYSFTGQLQHNADLVTRSQEVLREIQELRSRMVALESAQRGFVITGDESLLQGRDRMVAGLRWHMERARELMAADPVQRRDLEAVAPLIDQRIDFGARLIDLGRRQGPEAARELLSGGTGIALGNAVALRLDAMEAEESRVLAGRRHRLDAVAAATFLLLPVGLFVNIAILLYGMFQLNAGTHRRVNAEAALRASEARYREFIEQASDGIFVLDGEGRFMLVNPRARELLGYEAAELLGADGALLYPEAERHESAARIVQARQGATLRYERLVRRKDGSTFPAEFTSRMLDSGVFQIIFRDITQRREQEQRIARLNRVQAMLSGINSAIVRIRDRDELLREACRIAAEIGAFPITLIGMVQPDGSLQPVAWGGAGEALYAAVPRDAWPASGGVAVQALAQTATVVDNDIARAPALDQIRAQAIAMGARSAIGLPLFQDGQRVGVFLLYGGEPNLFDAAEVKLLEELAGDVSFALTFIAQQEKVSYLAYFDPLTGLPNSALFFDRLGRQIAAAQRERRQVALLMFDIDRFRNINDTLGRSAGDTLLKAVAGRILSVVREEDTVARVGGDGFAIAASGNWTAEELAHLIESRKRLLFGDPIRIGAEELRVAATVGVAILPHDATTAEALVANAEAALRSAKQQSVPLLFYGPEMNAQAALSLRMENRLHRALERGDLALWYQPKVSATTGALTGFEALMRWIDPEEGVISPARFIPMLEQTGLILDAGNWALAQVSRDCASWKGSGLPALRIAVNVSPMQLRRKDFVSSVIDAADRLASADGHLDIEITESVIMDNVDAVIPKLQMLRGLDVQVYVDDFGTGYSSLAYVARLPLHALKIDRSFVIGMTHNEDSLNIVRSIISLAHSLRLRVVAEGVETEDHARLLRGLGCDELQGYLFGRPIPPEEVPALLARFASVRGAEGKGGD
jgi:diguanylate cyclase (GGDEF)-like protein/PAS domain S-box-containing protein